jgi:hypothetical protein
MVFAMKLDIMHVHINNNIYEFKKLIEPTIWSGCIIVKWKFVPKPFIVICYHKLQDINRV